MSKRLKILITGAGTGFGCDVALALVKEGHDVIAAVEIPSQVSSLGKLAESKGLKLRIEKLDVSKPADHVKAWDWDIDVLINNAGISEGGAVVDIPADHIRKQFEVNVIGPIGLTQGFVKKMIKNKKGKVVFISSVAGLTTDPFTGAYSASKHAIEAFAMALNKEVKEFGIQVAVVNPGPFLTGFNDRMFETWKDWEKPTDQNVFDYNKIAFPHAQFDPAVVVERIVEVAIGANTFYRNVVPLQSEQESKKQMDALWTLQQNEPVVGKPDELVKEAYKMKPGTPA
ncbi:Short-chain dehydrogenase [bacterium A37T11]|nr:Short-chain dehydrogenase [bacterium A37T11]